MHDCGSSHLSRGSNSEAALPTSLLGFHRFSVCPFLLVYSFSMGQIIVSWRGFVIRFSSSFLVSSAVSMAVWKALLVGSVGLWLCGCLAMAGAWKLENPYLSLSSIDSPHAATGLPGYMYKQAGRVFNVLNDSLSVQLNGILASTCSFGSEPTVSSTHVNLTQKCIFNIGKPPLILTTKLVFELQPTWKFFTPTVVLR